MILECGAQKIYAGALSKEVKNEWSELGAEIKVGA